MGTKTIGNLAVLISANADKFESVMNGIEKRTVSFTSKITDIPNKVISGFGSLGSGFVSSADQVMRTAENLMSFLPGGKLAAVGMGLSGGLSGWGESAQRGLDTMQMLNRESERFGVSPKFFRALQMTAGADAQVVGPALDKILGAMGRLRSGDKGLTDAMTPFVDNLEQMKRLSPEDFLLKVADAYQKIGNQATKAAFAGSIFGDKMADDVHFLLNPDKISKSLAHIKSIGLYQDGNQGESIRAGNFLDRQVKLAQEKIDQDRGIKLAATQMADVAYQRGDLSWAGMMGLKRRLVTNADYAKQMLEANRGYMGVSDEKPVAITPQQFAERQRIRTLSEGRDALAKYNQELDKQAVMFGMNAHEAMMYELQLKGITKAELEKLDARFQIVEGKRMAEGLRGPNEKYQDEMDRIARARGLNPDQRQQLNDRAFDAAFQLREKLGATRSFLATAGQRPGAAEFGSAGAAEFMADLKNNAMTGAWQNDIAILKDTMLRLEVKQAEQNNIDRDILNSLRQEPDVRRVLAIPN